MSVYSAATWVKFFGAAGIPSNVSASYAHAFVENRMQMNMLMDLNKEYLREMGITPMGDIIAILRHAKVVHDQNTREKVLALDKVPVAAVSGNPIGSKVVKLPPKVKPSENRDNLEIPLPSKPRRVLPEHEGKYKVTLPSGTTQRTKEIMSKRAQLFPEKKPDRMDTDTDDEMPQMAVKRDITFKVVGLDKPTGSIFSRLGDKSRTDGRVIESTPSHAGILKNSPTKKVGIVKKASSHRVISVKRVPAKATTMVADEVEFQQKMELCEPQKSVSFSPEDEVVEFASRRASVKPKSRVGSRSAGNNVRSRLGLKASKTPTIAVLHKTRKTIKMKPGIIKSKLRSDDIVNLKALPVHSRLDLKRRAGTLTANALAARIGEVTLSTSPVRRKEAKQGNSVFHRLGFSGNANH
uniref:SAM domain-containing protein n=1 Tax=Phlebotomus kandelakii TaxID=1109342 RepID=A0A6B2E9R0_9DIPT